MTESLPRITGRTAQGRLCLIDQWCVDRLDPVRHVVEVGFGRDPVTAVEFFHALERTGHLTEFVAVETDLERAARAADCPFGVVNVRRFHLPPSRHSTQKWSVVRAINVLRGYSREVADEAWRTWSKSLGSDGSLIEGSTDDAGHVGVVAEVDHNVALRRLVFLTDFERGFAPRMFRDWLPRRWRRGGDDSAAVFEFLEEWQGRFKRSRSVGEAPLKSFRKSCEAMHFHWRGCATLGFLEWSSREDCV